MAREKLNVCESIRNLATAGFAVPVFLIGAVALHLSVNSNEAPISAFAASIPDADDDGVRDEFERSMFTDMNLWDSDGDTWSDAEEFSMDTNPGNPLRYPVVIPRLSTNLTARGENGRLHVLSAAYFMDASNINGAHFELGVLVGRRYRKFSTNQLAIRGESHSVAARPIGSKVAFFEISFPEALVQPGQRVTFLAMLTLPGALRPTAVSKLDVTKDAGSGVLLMEYPTRLMPNPPNSTHPLPSGSVYVPLPTSSTTPGGSIPLTWNPTTLCFKELTTVGKTGAILIQEVAEARCVPGFDGFCSPPICANTIGDQFQTIDPFSLVGAQ